MPTTVHGESAISKVWPRPELIFTAACGAGSLGLQGLVSANRAGGSAPPI